MSVSLWRFARQSSIYAASLSAVSCTLTTGCSTSALWQLHSGDCTLAAGRARQAERAAVWLLCGFEL